MSIYQHKNVPFLLLQIYDSEINHHYLKRYIKFIRHFKSIEPKEKRKGFENHHIFPASSCSKEFSKYSNNLVLLPLRAHYIVHWLLWKAFPNNPAMMFAFHQMSGRVKNKGIKFNSRVYEKLRTACGEIKRESARKRVKNGTHHLLGPETNRKMVENRTHPFLGKGKINVFDIESEKCLIIQNEEYHKNRDRYFNLNSKVYKEFKLRKQKS